MTPIKIGGKIFGARLTRAEEEAMHIEICKQMAEYTRKDADEISAMVLWILYNRFDFTDEQLEEFYRQFDPDINALCDRYEMHEDGDAQWLCTKKLLDAGIDISKWKRGNLEQ
jgi:hypothetical protein